MRLIIVRKGALSTFRFLEQSCKDIAGLRVIWDRRRGSDRRVEQNAVARDGRAADRRRHAPHSWTSADHVLAGSREVEPLVERLAGVGVFDEERRGV
jgi:hypothetical protein